jgi:hypothetical protein
MSDERALHDDSMSQDWAGGPNPVRDWMRAHIDGLEDDAQAEAHYQAWRAAGGEQQIETDRAQDEAQDERATGPSFEQELRCRQLESEAGGRDVL